MRSFHVAQRIHVVKIFVFLGLEFCCKQEAFFEGLESESIGRKLSEIGEEIVIHDQHVKHWWEFKKRDTY